MTTVSPVSLWLPTTSSVPVVERWSSSAVSYRSIIRGGCLSSTSRGAGLLGRAKVGVAFLERSELGLRGMTGLSLPPLFLGSFLGVAPSSCLAAAAIATFESFVLGRPLLGCCGGSTERERNASL